MSMLAKLHQFRDKSDKISIASGDNALRKQVQATHVPDGRKFDVKPLLNIIEDMFRRAGSDVPGFDEGTQAQLDAFDFQYSVFDMLDLLSPAINKVSSEIVSNCSGGTEAHETTMEIFNILTSYTWDAKVVIAMAAFALNCGEFGVVTQLYPSNPIAKSAALLKPSSKIEERVNKLKQKFKADSDLIKAMLDLTKCIAEFKEIPSEYITSDTPEMLTATDHIVTAVYWIIRSIVACSAPIFDLIDKGHEYKASTMEAWETASLAHKITNLYDKLRKELQLIDEKRQIEAYQLLVRFMETPQMDNMKVLRRLIDAKDDQLPLSLGPNRKRVSIDVLRRKNVLLFISEPHSFLEEPILLEQIYLESRQHSARTESQYEVVWLPVVDRSTPWTEAEQTQFDSLKVQMPWYSVHHPSMIDPTVIRYIKEKWGFKKKSIIVALDPQGKVVNESAHYMMWIWGSLAFPFTSDWELALWNEESWRIELLADSIDPNILSWIAEEKYICLYGGEDVEWIRKFTMTLRMVAQTAGVPLEILYVGKSNHRERVRRNMQIINMENLSYTLMDHILVWFFWVRLESMWHSKSKFGKTVEDDPIMREIAMMLSFDGSDQGWAVICKGSEMARAKDATILLCLLDYDRWKTHAEDVGFVGAIDDYLIRLQTPLHSSRMIFPESASRIPERIACTECGRLMEKFIMYQCSND